MLPEGTLLKKEVDLSQASLSSLLGEIARKGVTGYIAVTCRGGNGLEEGVLLYDSGTCVGSVYEYLRTHKKVQGRPAFVRIVNATAAKSVFADVVELKQADVRDFLARNENAVYAPSRQELEQARATRFSNEFEEQVESLEAAETPEALLKKYKLSDVLAGFKKPQEKPVERQVAEDGRITPPPVEQAEAAKPAATTKPMATQAKIEKPVQPKPLPAAPAGKKEKESGFNEVVLGEEEPSEGETKPAKKGKDEAEEMMELLSLPQAEKEKPKGRLGK